MGKCAWHALQNTSQAFLSWAVASAQQDASSDFQVIGAGELLCVATCQWKKTFVVFGRSGKCINGNGTNISDGSDIEDWIVDVARVKVEESYKECDVFSESSDDNDSHTVRTTTNIGHAVTL